jgi:hypothetical protein
MNSPMLCRCLAVASFFAAGLFSIVSAAPDDQRITRFSTRSFGGSGSLAVTAGFAIGDGAPKKS